jgi:nucleotide-binding universal stress UspA family protein
VGVAAHLADRLGVRLIVAHVVQVPVATGYDGLGRGGTFESGEEVAHGLLHRVAMEEGIPGAERRFMSGVPAEQLAELADQEDAEMIVVGSGAGGAFERGFLGGVSHDLIGLAHCPVVVVPPGAADRRVP